MFREMDVESRYNQWLYSPVYAGYTSYKDRILYYKDRILYYKDRILYSLQADCYLEFAHYEGLGVYNERVKDI